MRADLKPDEMKKLNFIRTLPYSLLLEAHKIIDKGADISLLYFWFNLTQGNYYPLFKVIDVEKQCVYYCERNPAFETDILSWFKYYEQLIKSKA